MEVGSTLLPVPTKMEPELKQLLELISCNRKGGCATKCDCRKSGLHCTAMCAQCRGLSCLNSKQLCGGESDTDDDDSHKVVDVCHVESSNECSLDDAVTK
jgi:hypothetical protein